MSYLKLVLLALKLVNFLIDEGKKRKLLQEGELRAIEALRRSQDARVAAALAADTGELPDDPDDPNNRRNRPGTS